MCGIAGIVYRDPQHSVSLDELKPMLDRIIHRGPDDWGYHIDGSVGFGMRRLSIIDLATGHQPIHNEDSTVWTVFNGEIYNFQIGRAHV
jgi:asparagine synthase (glutamine-hydrolysing)